MKRISLCTLMAVSCFVSAADKKRPSKQSPTTVIASLSQLVSACPSGQAPKNSTTGSFRRLVPQSDGTVLEELNFSRADQESAAKQKQNLIDLEAELAALVAVEEKNRRIRFFAPRSWTNAAVAGAIIAPALKSNLQACLNLMQNLREKATGQLVPKFLLEAMENLNLNAKYTFHSCVLPDIESAIFGKLFLDNVRRLGTVTLTLAGAAFCFAMVPDYGKQVSLSAFRNFEGKAGKTALQIVRLG